jgi:hypothetical protein
MGGSQRHLVKCQEMAGVPAATQLELLHVPGAVRWDIEPCSAADVPQ